MQLSSKHIAKEARARLSGDVRAASAARLKPFLIGAAVEGTGNVESSMLCDALGATGVGGSTCMAGTLPGIFGTGVGSAVTPWMSCWRAWRRYLRHSSHNVTL
jgi:hypothetical protein